MKFEISLVIFQLVIIIWMDLKSLYRVSFQLIIIIWMDFFLNERRIECEQYLEREQRNRVGYREMNNADVQQETRESIEEFAHHMRSSGRWSAKKTVSMNTESGSK